MKLTLPALMTWSAVPFALMYAQRPNNLPQYQQPDPEVLRRLASRAMEVLARFPSEAVIINTPMGKDLQDVALATLRLFVQQTKAQHWDQQRLEKQDFEIKTLLRSPALRRGSDTPVERYPIGCISGCGAAARTCYLRCSGEPNDLVTQECKRECAEDELLCRLNCYLQAFGPFLRF